jgi:two-component system LytT family response regulator
MISIRALIVDDEPLARERIRSLLAADGEIEVAGECANGEEAVSATLRERPDLLFLDVQMPGLDGFDVLGELPPEVMPVVIFVTAYDQHALRAFEVHALDYLLKPFDEARFRRSLERAKGFARARRARAADGRLDALLEELAAERRYVKRLVIQAPGRVFFLRAEEIDWIETAGNYVRLHVGAEAHLHRETMRDLESRLDPERFLRIHRSTIVNLDQIRDLKPLFHGGYAVTLKDGTELTSSRNYAERLRSLFGPAA